MGINVCPAAVVAAPVESVWELLSDPTLYDEWWNARTERIVPEGKASPGQVVYAKTAAFGRHVTLRIEMVNPARHQIQFYIALPLGTINHQTTTCTAIDPASSSGAAARFSGAAASSSGAARFSGAATRVQFG